MMSEGTNNADTLIFLVDDDQSFRKSTARLLTMSEFTVHDYASVGEFLMGFSRQSRACLLLDIHMPGPDGMELLEHLRKEGAELPVVFLTGHGDVPTAVNAMRKGAFDFLTKPVEKKRLLEVIEKALAHGVTNRLEGEWVRELKERFTTLTPTEKKIYRMVVDGLPNKAIAAQMGNAERTVKHHRSSLYRKMGAQCGADLVRFHFEGKLEA